MVKYLLEKNVEFYKQVKLVSSTMTGFHESCTYGFSQVCILYIENHQQDVNETFSLNYENIKTNKKEVVRNLTGLQLACLWSKYFPKRFISYAHTVRILLNHGARVNIVSTELTTPLHWTCRAQHTTQLAQDLIEHGALISARDRFNIQPIHYACWSRNQKLVEIFLSKGIQLTEQDSFNRTPLHFLCMPTYTESISIDDQQQQYELMKFLLENSKKNSYRIDLSKRDNQGYTLLAYACVSENVPLMELILKFEGNLLNQPTLDDRTPLMICIDEGFLSGIEFLLKQHGLQRNLADQHGNTAIHHACMCTNASIRTNILETLLNDQHGLFDYEKRNGQVMDPFMMCTVNQSVDLCRLLISKNVCLTRKDPYSRQSLHLACQFGNYELVSLITEHLSSADLNEVDCHHRNALFYAIDHGNEQIVNLLIEKNIQIQIQDRIGDTPLHIAVQHPTNAFELTNSILKHPHGKNLVNVPAADGTKPLHLAATSKQPEVINLLLKNGVDVKAVDNEHHTALHLACKSGCLKSVFYLIEFGGLDVNELDCYRQSPIFYAYSTNNLLLVQYLLSCGARIDLRDTQNYLPFHIGILTSNPSEKFEVKLIDLYREKHSDLLDDQNNEGQMTPLILACMQGKIEIVQHLIENYHVNVLAKCSNGHTPLHYACLISSSNTIELIEYLMTHGCDYQSVDQPRGSFLYTIVQHGDRKAVLYFIDYWLKTKPNINEIHYDSTLLDLVYNRSQLHHHDLDKKYLRQLFEAGASFYSANVPSYPCSLANDCPQFYLILLEYNCSTIGDKQLFIFNLLKTLSIHPDTNLLINENNREFISVCDYVYKVIQIAHYFYRVEHFYGILYRHILPQLANQQSSEDMQKLTKRIDQLRSRPLKLSEITRKKVRIDLSSPTSSKIRRIPVTKYLLDFLEQIE